MSNKPVDLTDPENPEWTAADFARAKLGAEVLPQDVLDAFARARRLGGRPEGSDKQPVTIRLNKAVVDHFKAGGKGWQTRINDALVALVEKKRA